MAISTSQLPASPLPQPLFTPSTKATAGHDENIDRAAGIKLVGKDLYGQVEELTLKVYSKASAQAQSKGIILADTKLEFGLFDGEVILIDEALTPDSSRYWPVESYQEGVSPPSFDKQFVRDYLESTGWDKKPPAPALPADIISKTSEKYIEAYERISGKKFAR